MLTAVIVGVLLFEGTVGLYVVYYSLMSSNVTKYLPRASRTRTQVLSVNQYLTFLLHSKHNTFHCDEHLSSTSEYDCCDLEFVRQNNRNVRCFDYVLGFASLPYAQTRQLYVFSFSPSSLFFFDEVSFDLIIRYTLFSTLLRPCSGNKR